MIRKLTNRPQPGHTTDQLRDYDRTEVYVPPFQELSAKVGIDRKALDADTITIPTALFRFLMSAWLRRLPFDVNHYLKTYADLAEARRAGTLASPHAHFVWTGYYEGRSPCEETVDEAFYLREYPDVARAVRTGQIASATEHYRKVGLDEGRSPDEKRKVMQHEWSLVLVNHDSSSSKSSS